MSPWFYSLQNSICLTIIDLFSWMTNHSKHVISPNVWRETYNNTNISWQTLKTEDFTYSIFHIPQHALSQVYVTPVLGLSPYYIIKKHSFNVIRCLHNLTRIFRFLSMYFVDSMYEIPKNDKNTVCSVCAAISVNIFFSWGRSGGLVVKRFPKGHSYTIPQNLKGLTSSGGFDHRGNMYQQ